MLSSSITPFLQLTAFAKGFINFQLANNKNFVVHGTMVKNVFVIFEASS